ncbi:MAG: DUF11 domain-containing protein [Anaerolineae bacterium]|nr:DUF11 domain-containing protein [Anaerolineae bacterium]
MKTKDIGQQLMRFGFIIVAVTLLSGYFGGMAQAAPPAQDPRPPIDTSGPGGGSNNGGDSSDDGPSAITCASVSGEVLNWGFRAEPGVVTTLETGSWQATTLSDNDGQYRFGGLGLGLARLNVTLAPGEPLTPLIEDAIVYLTCDYPTYANIALYSGDSIEPPVIIGISASSQVVTVDDETELTFTVENTMPTAISNVIVTSLIHPGLEPVAASAPGVAEEQVQIINGGDDGRVLVAYLDNVAAGEIAQVSLTVRAVEDTPFTDISNSATVFYRESVADQTSLDLTISSSGLAVPAALTGSTDRAAVEDEAAGTAASAGPAAREAEPVTPAESAPTAVEESSAAPTTEAAASTTQADEADEAEQAMPATADETEESAFAPPKSDDESLLPKTGQAPDEALAASKSNAVIPMIASITLLLGFVAYGVNSVRQRHL